MNPLQDHLRRIITREGPITIAHYMAEALGNPRHGYYMSQEPFGRSGDFITAPEVSQMFGELIGLWVADYWQRMGMPDRLALIELGPGRGTLMADALRAMKTQPGLVEALQLHLVEMSPRLREIQAEKLVKTISPQWHDTLGQAVEATGGAGVIILANEFFDALPIRQFVRDAQGWHERLVGIDAVSGALAPVLSALPAPESAMLHPDVAAAAAGSLAELCPSGLSITGDIAATLNAQGGAALIIDYGYTRSQPGDSLQAMKAHRYVPVFENPGTADITAHVDFAALARAAQGLRVFGAIEQGRFLINLGIAARADALKRRATEAQANDINSALHRLTDAAQMGSLFKVMALTSKDGPTPSGFENMIQEIR